MLHGGGGKMDDGALLQDLFEQLVGLPQAERDRVLLERCPSDAMRARIRRMLEAYDEDETLFEEPIGARFRELLDAPERRVSDFEVMEEIGRGGMSTVFRARDVVLDREVALKILGADRAMSETTRQRFLHEARAAAGLNHPNIVKIFRYGETERHCYIAMEYVRGGTLVDLLSRTDVTGVEGRRAVVRMIADLADALDAAHRAGVIHRDVKPGNVLMGEDGRVILADFGIARVAHAAGLAETLAGAGTTPYMSPEQIAAIRDGIDHRTDIFSLGIVLYEVLTKRRPFQGRSHEDVRKAISATQAARPRSIVRSIPRDLEVITGKAMEKRPADRYPTAGHMSADLRAWLAGDPILARPPGVTRRASAALRSRRSVVIGLGAAIAGSAIGVYAYGRLSDDRPVIRTGLLPTGADVLLRLIDDETRLAGEARRLGRADHGVFRLDPGHYRIVVVEAGGGFMEYERFVEPGSDVELRPAGPSLGDVTTGMARIEGGASVSIAADATDEQRRYAERVAEVGAFWIDRHEVSNRLYAAFLAANAEVEAPSHWGGREPPEGWGDLAVSGVTYNEAQGYAEWVGKRLPSALEWELAMRGDGGRLWPWSDGNEGVEVAAIEAYLGSMVRPPPAASSAAAGAPRALDGWSPPRDTDACRSLVAERVRGVDDGGGVDVTPEGIVNGLGNVMEWTESLDVASIPSRRSVFGNHWSMAEKVGSFGAPVAQSVFIRRLGTGFRCVRTVREGE